MVQQCPPVGPVTGKKSKVSHTDFSLPVKKKKKKLPASDSAGEGGETAVSDSPSASLGTVRSSSPAFFKYEKELISDFEKYEEETNKKQHDAIQKYMLNPSAGKFVPGKKSHVNKSDTQVPQQSIKEKIDSVFIERFNVHFSTILVIFWVLAFFFIFVSYVPVSPLFIFLLTLSAA